MSVVHGRIAAGVMAAPRDSLQRSSCSQRERGFTLLELLVALAIFSLTSVLAYGGLQTVLKQRQHTDAIAQRLADVQFAMTLLGRDFEQLVPRAIRDQYGDSAAVLQSGLATGDGVRVELTRTGWRNPAGQIRSNLQRVAWALQDQQLQRWYWNVLDRAQDSEPVKLAILDGVSDFQFRYLDAQRQWRDSWLPDIADGDPQHVPLAVEVRLEIEGFGRLRRLFAATGASLPDSKSFAAANAENAGDNGEAAVAGDGAEDTGGEP